MSYLFKEYLPNLLQLFNHESVPKTMYSKINFINFMIHKFL